MAMSAFAASPAITTHRRVASVCSLGRDACEGQGPPQVHVARRTFLAGIARLSALSVATSGGTRVPRASASAAPDAADAEPAVISTTPTVGKKTATQTQTPSKVTWGYTSENGPEKWGTLNEDWAICSHGQLQSPISISYKSSKIASLGDSRPVLSVTRGSKFALRHKEATPQAAHKWLVIEPVAPAPPAVVGDAPPVDVMPTPAPAAVITVPGYGRYRLKSAHFHTDGSEHVMNGVRGAMECHFVFPLERAEDTSSGAAPPHHVVVGLLIEETGTTSPWIDGVLRNGVKASGDEPDRVVEVDLESALPNFNAGNVYTYPGSLTTPPGSEGIYWIVMNDRAKVTREDRYLLENYQGGPNTRPLQETNGRQVTQFPAVISESRPSTAAGA